MLLYHHSEEDYICRFKLDAALHGANLTLEGDSTSDKKPLTKTKSEFTFQDPSTYAHLSKDEKEALTQRMMASHKFWHEGTPMSAKATKAGMKLKGD